MYAYKRIMAENFSILLENTSLHIQEVQGISSRKMQRDPQRHNTVKMLIVKNKEKILKAAREKQLFTYKWTSIRLIADSQQK